jgi:hypothetical protein
MPLVDLGSIEEAFRHTARTLTEAYEDSSERPNVASASPHILVEAAVRLLAVLSKMEQDDGFYTSLSEARASGTNDVHALTEHGIGLFSQLANWANALRLPQSFSEMRELTLALTLWMVRRDAEISQLEPVVDCLAYVANQIKAPTELEKLFAAASEIMDAVTPAIAQDIDHSQPGRPWRLLILNRAIIATRSHRPHLMEQAFQTLVDALPEDAVNFFREGMEQMDALDYPDPVREAMEKYFQLWCKPKTLH